MPIHKWSILTDAIDFIRKHSQENSSKDWILIRSGDLFIVRPVTHTTKTDNIRLIVTYRNGKQIYINWTEILSGLNTDISKISGTMNKYIAQVVERND